MKGARIAISSVGSMTNSKILTTSHTRNQKITGLIVITTAAAIIIEGFRCLY
jgi:hypothetical protein